MDRNRAKEKVRYIDKLEKEPRDRYVEKLKLINDFDPYDCQEKVWSVEPNGLPNLAFGDMLNYLVFGVSAYTLEEFKAFKSLEAHNQFSSGWVQDLKYYVPENCDNTVVKAKVLHSMRLNEKPLQPWVVLDSTGGVTTGHCDCMAGLAESCTHIGALLFKLEAVVRIREKTTVTGVPAYWMIPASISKVEPEVAHKIDFTSAATKRKQLEKAVNSTNPTTAALRTSLPGKVKAPSLTEDEFSNLCKELHKTGDRPAILSIMPGYSSLYKDPVKPVVLPKSLSSLKNSKYEDVSELELRKHCDSLFTDPRVAVSQEEAEKIEYETRLQRDTPAWFGVRVGRITASQVYNVMKFKYDKPSLSTVKNVCRPGRRLDVCAVKWGVNNEQQGVDMYTAHQKKEHREFSFRKSGFIINCDFPYMGASPDGLVNCECCGNGCLEVKCSYKHRNSTIAEACRDSAFCAEERNGLFFLKQEHPYFYQVQCQLLASKAEYCDFVLWTTEDFTIIRVVPDVEFFEVSQEKAKTFFLQVVLPELVARHYTCKESASTRTCTHFARTENTPACETRKVSGKGKKKATLWCHCRQPEDTDDMVACDNQNCNVQWYHIGCVGLEVLPTSDDMWFCSACLNDMKQ